MIPTGRLLAAARLIFILATPVLLFALNIDLATHSQALYRYGFDRYGAAARLKVAPEEVYRAGKELIAYWDSPQQEARIVVRRGGLAIDLFNQREIAHLRDVKALIAFNRRLMAWLLTYTATFALLGLLLRRAAFWEYLLGGLKWGGLLTLGLLLLLGIGGVANFQGLYTLFHLLSFPNLLWVLDPATDRLIQMITPEFQRDAALMVIAATATEGVLLVGLGRWGTGRLSPVPKGKPRR